MNRDAMIAQARQLLEDLGMDSERSNERSAITLLALARLDDTMSWSDVYNQAAHGLDAR